MNHSGYSSMYVRSSHKSLQYKAAGGTCNHVRVEEVVDQQAAPPEPATHPKHSIGLRTPPAALLGPLAPANGTF